ncbi:MAG TPA: TetR/AcrR family transcriptional regulator [Spirochaetota bacterium]|nr:TetR/AcrR family transcriptional regulator [Spirochaetota bacterium]
MRKGEQTKEYLVACAERIFAQRGYHETQIADIVNRAHVAKGTIYQYFQNKEDIFLTLIKKYFDEWEDAVQLILTDFSGEHTPAYYAQQYLMNRIRHTFDFFNENNDRCRIILRMSLGINPFIESLLSMYEEKITSIIVSDIKLGQKWGNIDNEINPDIAGSFIMGAVLRAAYLFFINRKRIPSVYDLASLVDDTTKLICNTLKME